MSRRRSRNAWLRRCARGPNFRRRLQRNPLGQVRHSCFEEFIASLPKGDGFGDDYLRFQPNSVRIAFQNINGVPERVSDDKQIAIKKWVEKQKVAILLLSEMNRYWPSVVEGNKWRDRARKMGREGYFTSCAWNSQQNRPSSSSFQYGGCTATVFGKSSHSAKNGGTDPLGLGRWAWVRLRGRNQVIPEDDDPADDPQAPTKDVVVVSAYRPNPPGTGTSTVWFQHRNYLLSIGRSEDPRSAFLTDLLGAIEQWRLEGCEVVLGIDANEDVSVNSPSSIRNRLREAGLRDAILSRHPAPPPATYQQNENDIPIDGLYTTPGIRVKASGYYPFSEFAPSDHRGLWADIDVFSALGGYRPRPSSQQSRKLSMRDRPSVRRYIRSVEEGYRHHKISERLDTIERKRQANGGTLTPTQLDKFNKIHAQIATIRRRAERYCRKRRMGGVPWSPKLQALRDKLDLWRTLIQSRKRVRVSSTKLRRLIARTGLPEAWRLSLEDLVVRQRDDRKTYTTAKRTKAAEWRREHVDLMAASAAKEARKKNRRANERRNRTRMMTQRETARRQKVARKKGTSGGLNAIQVETSGPDGTVELVTCTTRAQVEAGCMQENQARYDQTRYPFPTPPMEEPLYSAFTGPNAELNSLALLDGSWSIPADLPAPTQAFLRQCEVPPSHEFQDLNVTTSDHIRFWNKNPENKGSEPHGLHNGHFKAGAQSELISSCDAMIRQIPMQTGVVPDQWKHLMNFAIEKKPGEIRVKKMRTIQMMNSELQANNKMVGRKAMQYAEAHQMIPPGQCGSRKQHQAIDLALSKRCVWDGLILSRRSAGWICNDAKSCFDRVVHWVAIVCMMRFGIGWLPLLSMFTSLQLATHRVRTGFGDSTVAFSPPSDIPFQGCGQGNGAGPCIWVAISSVLIGMMTAAGYGYTCTTALTGAKVLADCFCFVDDTDLVEAASDNSSSGESILDSVQQALTLWSGGVSATGGAINPEKSFWWLIDFRWDASHGRWIFRKGADMPGSIELQGLDGNMQDLQRLEPDQAERTLGVMMAPLHNPDPQADHLRKVAKEWATTVKTGRLLRSDVFPMISSTIMKTLQYPMALTFLSAKTWTKIMSPILMVCLPKAGVCRNFPRAVVYAPKKYQGLGIPHPYALQVTSHLEMLLRHHANDTQTGKFLEANLQAHQIETGTSYRLFQQVYGNTAILTSDTWLKRVWKEMDDLDIHLEYDAPGIELQRVGDKLLTEIFMEAEMDQEDLKWLNWCRLHLQALTLADIVTPDGTAITVDAWEGTLAPLRVSSVSWPRTERPSEHRWRKWRQFWTSHLTTGTRRRLRDPLGEWFDDVSSWHWAYSPERDELFSRESPSSWVVYSRVPGRTRRKWYRPISTPGPVSRSSLPPECHRAMVSFSSTAPTLAQLVSTGISLPAVIDDEHAPGSILDVYEQLQHECDDTWGWVPESISIQGDEEVLLQALLKGDIRIVSDGSFKNRIGTASVQITTKDRDTICWVLCKVPGLPTDQSAYRSELVGLLSGILVVSWMWKILVARDSALSSQPGPDVTISCDGSAALDNALDSWHVKPTRRQFDVLSTIRALRRSLPIKWIPKHVMGHVDKYKTWAQMSWFERRNCEVDAKASKFRDELETAGELTSRNPRFFQEPVSLFISGEKQSSLEVDAITELIVLEDLEAYWSRRGRIQADALTEIDWTASDKAMANFPAGIQRWVAKHTVGMCGVGKFRKIWGLDAVNQCPRCGAAEDHLHVPRCPSATASSRWKSEVELIQSWMQAQQTAPDIMEAMTQLLATIRGPVYLQFRVGQRILSSQPQKISLAIESQKTIGFQGFLDGLLSHHWATLQQSHYDSIGSRRSGNRWAAGMVQQLLMLGHAMWEDRNKVQHSDSNVQLRQLSRDTDAGIREQFRMGEVDLPASARPRLRVPIQKVLDMPLNSRKEWLSVIRKERAATRRSLAAQRRMMYDLTHQP